MNLKQELEEMRKMHRSDLTYPENERRNGYNDAIGELKSWLSKKLDEAYQQGKKERKKKIRDSIKTRDRTISKLQKEKEEAYEKGNNDALHEQRSVVRGRMNKAAYEKNQKRF